MSEPEAQQRTHAKISLSSSSLHTYVAHSDNNKECCDNNASASRWGAKAKTSSHLLLACSLSYVGIVMPMRMPPLTATPKATELCKSFVQQHHVCQRLAADAHHEMSNSIRISHLYFFYETKWAHYFQLITLRVFPSLTKCSWLNHIQWNIN